jgi:uncharacterized membrane protein
MAADVLPIDGITHAIQLAVTPVFLLSAVAMLIGVLTGRLGRAVDRRRVLVSALAALDAPLAAGANGELAFVKHRISTIYAAIALSVMGALLICLTIAVAFMAVLAGTNLARMVAVLFVLAMLALIAALALLLREIYLAVNTVSSPLR